MTESAASRDDWIESQGLRRHLATAALVIAALLAPPVCAASAEADCRRALRPGTLEPGVGFGGLRLGMSPEEVTRLVGPPERGGDGAPWEYPSCGFAVVFDHDRNVGALVAGDATGTGPELAEAFTVETPQGLGIGSSREQIVAALGEPTETQGEGSEQLLAYPAQGVSWLLREGRVEHVTVRRRQ